MSYDIYPGMEVAYVAARFVGAVSDDQAVFETDDGGFLAEAGIETGGRIDMAARGFGRATRHLGYAAGDAAVLVMERRSGVLLELSSPDGGLMETWDAGTDTIVEWWPCKACGDRVPDRRVHWVGGDAEDGPYCYEDAERANTEAGA